VTTVKDVLVHLALDVTKMTRSRWDLLLDVMKDDAAMNCIMREEWHAKPRDSEEAIREYYRESDIWFINTFNHGVGALVRLVEEKEPPPLTPWQKTFTGDFKISGPILDYGGGFFNDSWPLILSGYEVVIAEVRGPVTELLKRYRDLMEPAIRSKIGVVEVDTDLPIKETYRGAVCFEVLEHLLYPVEFVYHLREHLATGSPFAFSVSFGDTPHAPYHVARNAALGNEKVFASKLGEAGFRQHWKDEQGYHLQIWKSGL